MDNAYFRGGSFVWGIDLLRLKNQKIKKSCCFHKIYVMKKEQRIHHCPNKNPVFLNRFVKNKKYGVLKCTEKIFE